MDRIFRMTAWHSRIARNEPEEKGERLSRTVASRAAVPFSSLGRWCAEPDRQRDIFVFILSILAILSRSSAVPQFPQFLVHCRLTATRSA